VKVEASMPSALRPDTPWRGGGSQQLNRRGRPSRLPFYRNFLTQLETTMAMVENSVPAFEGVTNVKAFGAEGDGQTDDTQALLDAHEAGKHGLVLYPAGRYVVSDTLPIDSRTAYLGANAGHPSQPGGVTLVMPNADVPVFASRGWLDNSTGGATGRWMIENFAIEGNRNNSNQHGLVIRDFYGKIRNIRIRRCGGNGIHLTEKSQDGETEYTAGNLIENYIENCIITDLGAGSVYYFLGEDHNNKFTDGYLLNCAAFHQNEKPLHYLRAGSAVGWRFEGFHAYGSESNAEAPDEAVFLANGWYTFLSKFYIESFRKTAIRLAASQRSTHLADIGIRGRFATDGARIIRTAKSANVSRCDIYVSNLAYHHTNAVDATLIYSPSSLIDIHIVNDAVTGSQAHRVTRYGDQFGEPSIRRRAEYSSQYVVGDTETPTTADGYGLLVRGNHSDRRSRIMQVAADNNANEKVVSTRVTGNGNYHIEFWNDGGNLDNRFLFRRNGIAALPGTLDLENVPTSDPGVPGRVWRNGNQLMIST